MSLFRKIFGSKSKEAPIVKGEERGKYMPDIKIPVDERFTINFKANGGKFLYCENLEEVFHSLEQILNENTWEDKKVIVIDDNIKSLFKDFNLSCTTKSSEGIYFITTCENLIADDG